MYKCTQLSLHFHSCATSSLKNLNYITSVQFSAPLVGLVLDNCVLEQDVNVMYVHTYPGIYAFAPFVHT